VFFHQPTIGTHSYFQLSKSFPTAYRFGMEPFGRRPWSTRFGMFNDCKLPWIPHRPECSVQSGLQHSFIAGREFPINPAVVPANAKLVPGACIRNCALTLISWSLRIERELCEYILAVDMSARMAIKCHIGIDANEPVQRSVPLHPVRSLSNV